MKRVHYIASDTHCPFCEVVAVTHTGEVRLRERCETTIPVLVEVLEKVPHPRRFVIEEGSLADWLYRNLRDHVDEMIVCDPRRNALVAKDSDKDDPIDAEKLAQLYRGGYVKAVHHPESLERTVFKQHVGLYYNRVGHRVREANRVMSELRRHGVFVRERAFVAPEDRPALVRRLPECSTIRENLQLLWASYDLACEHEQQMRGRLIRLAREREQVRRFEKVPGFGWIRSATFFAYVDTPWRFASKSALWRYLGIGLERRHSGSGPLLLRVARHVNRTLKSTMLGAATSVIACSRDNPFAEQYRRWIAQAISPRNARRNVARSLAATLWGMWKSGSVYRPDWVGAAAASAATG